MIKNIIFDFDGVIVDSEVLVSKAFSKYFKKIGHSFKEEQFYKYDGNIGNEIRKIDNSKCPIYLLTGEYDYSATPEETKILADTIGIEMVKMKNVGHFPMSENPEEFLKYLHPVLEKIS